MSEAEVRIQGQRESEYLAAMAILAGEIADLRTENRDLLTRLATATEAIRLADALIDDARKRLDETTGYDNFFEPEEAHDWWNGAPTLRLVANPTVKEWLDKAAAYRESRKETTDG